MRHPARVCAEGGTSPAGIAGERTRRAIARFRGLLAVWLCAAACSPAATTEPNALPDVAGEWAYTASDVRIVGRNSPDSCEIRDMRLFLGPWRFTGFFGRSEGGEMVCTGELASMGSELSSYPVRRGGAVLNFIAFDIGNPDWRHDGTITADTMRGAFTLQQPKFRMTGSFRAVRQRSGTGAAAGDPAGQLDADP